MKIWWKDSSAHVVWERYKNKAPGERLNILRQYCENITPEKGCLNYSFDDGSCLFKKWGLYT